MTLNIRKTSVDNCSPLPSLTNKLASKQTGKRVMELLSVPYNFNRWFTAYCATRYAVRNTQDMSKHSRAPSVATGHQPAEQVASSAAQPQWVSRSRIWWPFYAHLRVQSADRGKECTQTIAYSPSSMFIRDAKQEYKAMWKQNHLQINLWETQWLRRLRQITRELRFRIPSVAQLLILINHPKILGRPHDYKKKELPRTSWWKTVQCRCVPESGMMKTWNEHQYASGYWQLTVKSTRSRHVVIRWNGGIVPLTPNLKVRDEWPASHSGRFISKKSAPGAYCIER